MDSLIVDDDRIICDLLEHFCDKVESINAVTITNSGFECVNLISRNKFDLIFLDYDLPDLSGKEILSLIDQHTAVIIITSNREFAAETYGYGNVVDYLVKPINFPRFLKGILQVEKWKNIGQSERTIFIKSGSNLIKIEFEEVLYFKAEANYVAVVFDNRKILTLMTVKDLVDKLPDYFQQVHRSYVVNVRKIDSIQVNILKVGQFEIPLSQSREKELLSKINLL